MEKRKRGRPRNAESPDPDRKSDTQKDEVIARTVGRLIWMGFPQRGEEAVYATVARCARDVLKRFDRTTSTQQPLSSERIEQIYKLWKKQNFRRQWLRKNFTKDSLQDRIPWASGGAGKRTLSDIAAELLQNGGYLPKTVYDTYIDPWTGEEKARYLEDMIGHADPDVTPKAYAEYLAYPYLRKRGN